MSALADRSLGQLLEQVAAESPSPGGGSSCALACALAAGLVEMAAAFTLARASTPSATSAWRALRERAGELRAEALELAERELTVYGAVLDALRAARGRARARASASTAALSDAADSPLAVARAAAEVAGLAAEVAHTGNRHLRGDAISAPSWPRRACTAAARLAEINLTGPPRGPAPRGGRRAAQARAGGPPDGAVAGARRVRSPARGGSRRHGDDADRLPRVRRRSQPARRRHQRARPGGGGLRALAPRDRPPRRPAGVRRVRHRAAAAAAGRRRAARALPRHERRRLPGRGGRAPRHRRATCST